MRFVLLACLVAIGCGHPSQPPPVPVASISVDAAPPPPPPAPPADKACGGIAGIACPSGFSCDYQHDCHLKDAMGTCVPKVTTCPSDDAPVCACDGETFANDCERQLAHAHLDHDGPC